MKGDFVTVNTAQGRAVLLRYLTVMAVLNLVWEVLQMPLYTLWLDGTLSEIAYGIVHCAAGDVMIAASALLAALMIVRPLGWPAVQYWQVVRVAVLFGLAYTVFSEWLNVEIRQSWAYRDVMPRLPLLGTGASPVLQWILLPPLAFWWAKPRRERHERTG